MKEATGELNVTVIVVLAVGLLSAFFYLIIWPGIKNNTEKNSMCSKAWCENPCGNHNPPITSCGARTAKCHYKSGGSTKDIECPWKG